MEQLLIRHIIKTGNIARRCIDRQAQSAGIDFSGGHMGLFGYLAQNQGGEVYQKDLEQSFALARSTVSGILRNMEEAGLVRREAVAGDARLKRVVLTQKAHELHSWVEEEVGALETRVSQAFSPAEKLQFLDFLERAANHLHPYTDCHSGSHRPQEARGGRIEGGKDD